MPDSYTLPLIDEGLPGRRIAMSHFGVSCLDIEPMVDFYTQVIGLSVSDRGVIRAGGGTSLVFLTTDPRDHHQFVLASGREDPVIETGSVDGGSIGSKVFQVSFRIRDLATLREIARRVRAAGIEDLQAMSHGNAWSVYFRDPEGNALELFVDAPWYVSQPCAEPFDLDWPDEKILDETRRYCLAQEEVMTYADWSRRMADQIRSDQGIADTGSGTQDA